MTVHVLNLRQFAAKLTTMEEDIRQAMVRGLRSAGRRMEGLVVEEIQNAKPYPAVDRGDLVNSVEYVEESDGSRVQVTAPHAAVVEEGSRPFRPPIAPLVQWALRKKIADNEDEAYQIAHGIRRKFEVQGFTPRWYMKKAVRRTQPFVIDEIERELDAL